MILLAISSKLSLDVFYSVVTPGWYRSISTKDVPKPDVFHSGTHPRSAQMYVHQAAPSSVVVANLSARPLASDETFAATLDGRYGLAPEASVS